MYYRVLQKEFATFGKKRVLNIFLFSVGETILSAHLLSVKYKQNSSAYMDAHGTQKNYSLYKC